MKQTGHSLAELAAGMPALSAGAFERQSGARCGIRRASRWLQAAVARIEKSLGGEGRVVLRPSGTEPVIRVMVEGRDEQVTRLLRPSLQRSCAWPRPKL